MKHIFPNEIYIGYAICKKCNNREFIVSGQSQICNNCGGLIFVTEERSYVLNKDNIEDRKIDTFRKNKLIYPKEIIVGYAKCSNVLNGEEVVLKDIVICQECKEKMIIEDTIKYFYSNKTYECPICKYDRLYKTPYRSNRTRFLWNLSTM